MKIFLNENDPRHNGSSLGMGLNIRLFTTEFVNMYWPEISQLLLMLEVVICFNLLLRPQIQFQRYQVQMVHFLFEVLSVSSVQGLLSILRFIVPYIFPFFLIPKVVAVSCSHHLWVTKVIPFHSFNSQFIYN